MQRVVGIAVIVWVLLFPAHGERVDLFVAHGVVDLIMARFIDRGIGQAENDPASCAVIELDTPGGLDSSMRGIVKPIFYSSTG